MTKRIYKNIRMALREAREINPQLTETDGICACYDIEDMGYCKDGKSRWYWFTDVNGQECYTIKR